MDQTQVIKKIEETGFEVRVITFLEDGYELLICPQGEIGKLWELNLEGFKVIDVSSMRLAYKVLIIPISLNEMTDFVWTYIEKNGRKDELVEDALLEAVTVLEKIVENSKDEEAIKNFETFESQIF